jgi:hypothetical protein
MQTLQPEFTRLLRFLFFGKKLDGDWSISEITVCDWLIFVQKNAANVKTQAVQAIFTFNLILKFLQPLCLCILIILKIVVKIMATHTLDYHNYLQSKQKV